MMAMERRSRHLAGVGFCLLLVCGACGDKADDASDGNDPSGGGDAGEAPRSLGCGEAATHETGGVQVTFDVGDLGGGARTVWLSLPAGYDPETPSSLIIAYPGTDWTGEQIQPYLGLEGEGRDDEIFVYPDPLWQDFEGWGTYGGWELGPHAAPANGEQDLVFTEDIIMFMSEMYCINPEKVFVTGHSWGGDMAQVAGCFLGELIRASVPVAANRPYWFEPSQGPWGGCPGNTAVWVMFGEGDDHFTWQDYPGQFGDEQRDFWLEERSCSGYADATDLGLGDEGECLEYSGCSHTTRYCLYGASAGHQVPGYYSEAVMEFFRGL